MREDYDFENDDVYPVAVAAVALVTKLLEEELGIKDRKKSEGLDTSLTKIKRKTEDTRIRASELGKISRRLSGESSMIDMEDPNRRVPSKIAVTNEKRTEKAIGPVQSFKRTPTFVDKDRKPESALPTPDLSSAKQPTSLPTEIKRQPSTKPGIGETKADTWEKAQMAKLKEKYEKLNTTILECEKKKEGKAKLQKDRTEVYCISLLQFGRHLESTLLNCRVNWSAEEQKPYDITVVTWKELIELQEEQDLKQRKTKEMRSSR